MGSAPWVFLDEINWRTNMAERLIRQRIFFFGMIVILAILTLILVWQFIQPILLAIAIVVILKPLYRWFLGKKWVKGSEPRAVGGTMLTFILVIAIPAVLIIGSAISQADKLFSGLDFEGLDLSLPGIITWIEDTLRGIGADGYKVDEVQITESLQGAFIAVIDWFGDVLISLGQSIPDFFMNTVVVLVIVIVLLPRYKRPGKQDILDLVPFPPEITQLFIDKVDMMITAMFKGTFVIAIAQGLAMGLVFWIAGVPYVMFLTIVSMFLSLVPFIGISLVAWPVGIVLLLIGNTWQGILVIVAFLIIVSNIDSVLRPILVPKGAYLNPALIILSVFGGLGVMGLIGALYGPVVMILLVTSIEVYTKYMLRSDLEVLEKEGRINLQELGLVPDEDQEDQGGLIFMNALKNISARFRRESQNQTVTTQAADSAVEKPV
jgi:predicted PurR-regulated permease PerM